jgi:hypothetical protein
MRKYWAYAPNTRPYLHNREADAIKASDRELLLKLLCVVVGVAIFVIVVMFYRHLHGWQVVQK